jgi:hypothetical protein
VKLWGGFDENGIFLPYPLGIFLLVTTKEKQSHSTNLRLGFFPIHTFLSYTLMYKDNKKTQAHINT